MQLTYRIGLVLLSLFVLVAGAEAQGVASEASGERIDVSVYTTAYAEGHQTVYLANGKDGVNEVRLSTANILGPYSTELDTYSNIILRTKLETEEGVTSYPPISQIKLPVGIKEPLIILVPAVGSLPYQAIIIDQSLERFPVGSYLLINLSSMDIRGVVGNTKVAVSAGSMTPVTPPSGQEGALDVHFEYESPKQWKTFARTRWGNETGKRSLLVASIDPKTKRMKIRGVPLKPASSVNE